MEEEGNKYRQLVNIEPRLSNRLLDSSCNLVCLQAYGVYAGSIKSCKVIAYPGSGPEALLALEVDDMSLSCMMDAHGRCHGGKWGLSYLTHHPPCLIFQGMTKALVLLSCLMLAVSCGGQADEASAASTRSVAASSSSDISSLPVPEDLGSRFAYVYGWRMAEALSQSGFSGDMSYVARGTADWLSGEALFSEEEMAQITEDFQREAFRKIEERYRTLMEENLQEAEAFLEGNGRRSGVVSLSDKVQYEVIVEGTGAGASPDDTVLVDYQLATLDGDVIESTEGRGGYQVSLSSTVPGFRDVVSEMNVGSRVRAWIHPDEAYGAYGNGNIGPNQLLIFDIELLDIIE